MLDANVTTRIREYINAELAPRERALGIALRDCQSKLAARGILNSSMAVQLYAQAGRDELTVRAKSIWAAIRRSHASLVRTLEPTTLDDLRQLITEYLDEHTKLVTGLAAARVGKGLGDPAKYRGIIESEIGQKAQELSANLDVEAQFYVDDRARAEAAAAGDKSAAAMNFFGPVSAVQPGTFATANVSLAGPDSERLREALDQLGQALEENTEIEREQREQALDLLRDAAAAMKAEKPNPPKIAGLLGGLGQVVRTIASLRGAWDVTRDAAIAVGIPL